MLCRPNNRHEVLSDVLSLFLRKHVFEQKPKVVAVYKPVYTSSELSCGERSAEGTDSPRDRRRTSRTYDQNTSRSIGRKTELKSITALTTRQTSVACYSLAHRARHDYQSSTDPLRV